MVTNGHPRAVIQPGLPAPHPVARRAVGSRMTVVPSDILEWRGLGSVNMSRARAIMSAIRRRVLADADGELRLQGLPIKKGEHAEVIVLTDALDDATADETTLAILRHDPAWAWLHDAAEDVYTEADIRPEPAS